MPYADVVSFTTHKVLRGPRGGAIVCKEEHAAKIDKAVSMMQGGPLMHTIAAKAVNLPSALPRSTSSTPSRSSPTRQLATTLGRTASASTTGGTDTHLSLHDLQGVGVTGKDAEERSDAAGIVLNKNAIPFDLGKVNIASGIRVGTLRDDPGHGHFEEMKVIGELIATVVTKGDADPDHAVSKEVRAQVTELVTRFPAYPR